MMSFAMVMKGPVASAGSIFHLFKASGTKEPKIAAKIITESIDPSAKVIFGAVIEDRSRKGPFRITLIASGFPGKEKQKSQRDLPIFRREQQHTSQVDLKSPKEVVVEEETKDPFEVPAFIRRKNK